MALDLDDLHNATIAPTARRETRVLKVEALQVLTTVDDRQKAQEIAKALVERRLVACAQVIGPIHSYYWWQGKLEEAEEWLLQLKTRAELYDELERVLKELHPYTVPEILAFPVVEGNPEYLEWLRRELARER
jgi:periplasmic divalent cation tolerance protein